MPHYAKCDVISEQNKKFKLKYLVNKTLERKSTKELVLKEQCHISRIFSFLFFLSLYRLLMDLFKVKHVNCIIFTFLSKHIVYQLNSFAIIAK